MATTFQVRSGDTLSRIAEFHGTTVDELSALNPALEDPDLIFPGQVLNVPETPEQGPSIHAEMATGPGPVWLNIALREMETGVDETPGPGSNPRILEYHATTTRKATDDAVPWCSSFVNWCVLKAGLEPTRSASARSWATWGEPLDEPTRGCIVVLSRPPRPTAGHVGFFDREENARVFLLGGNQGDQVSISSFSKSRLLAYRWPA